jgi:phosphoglycerol transferase MdoB-like AlkP superfamily enzyme
MVPHSLYGSSSGFLFQQVSSFFDLEYAEEDERELPENLQKITQVFKKKTQSLTSIVSEKTSEKISEKSGIDIFSGREKDSNVIFIVMETGPNKGFMDEKYPELFKNFNALKNKSFYSDQHLSSYLYTSDAMFSIFGSVYTDIKTRKDFLSQRKDKSTIAGLGIFDHLSRAGYDTGIYSPALPIVIDDEVMYQMLGVKHQFYAESDPQEISNIRNELDLYLKPLTDITSYNEKTHGKLDLQVPPDVVTLNKMLSDIEKNVKSGQKFASVFLPQVGHGPWPDVANSGRSDDMNNAKLLMSLQDHWIGQITDKLKELGIFENTVIVITSDHGLRTITEYSAMDINVINEASYGVPFLLYAPNSLKRAVKLTHHTSHIDIMPTVLSLLDLSPQKSCMLGINIWQNDLPNRRLYLLGRRYTGVDGYAQGGKYYSYHAVQKFAFKSDDFSFGKKSFLRKEQKEYLEVQSNINFQHAVQQKILNKLLNENCAF